jgi:flagellar basal-body rod protein FlgG
MSIEALQTATNALRVTSRRVDRTAHNLANVSTPGYVPTRSNQADAIPGGVREAGSSPMAQGPILPSDSPLDLAIDGNGFFILDDGQGGRLYTKAGNFVLNRDMELTDQMGREVLPEIEMPAETVVVSVTPQGEINFHNRDGAIIATGQLQTATFGNPGGLAAVGGNAFRETVDSGPPIDAAPGTPGHGEIVPGALQASGTDIAQEMVSLIVNQRVFEANLKTVQSSDEMLGSLMDIVG